MDQFEERLSRLGELSPEELTTLESELVAAFDAADQSGDVDTMSSIADAVDVVRAETSRRGAETTQPEMVDAPEAPAMAAAGEAATLTDEAPAPAATTDTDSASVAEDAPSTETITETAEPTETPAAEELDTTPEADDGSPEAPAEAEPETSEQGETITMDTSAETISASEVPEDHQPNLEPEAPAMPVIRAGGDIPGVTAGSELDSLDDVAEALTQRINSLRGKGGGGGEQIVVASIDTAVEDETRYLRRGDVEGNSRKVREALEMVRDNPMAITAAANGWCAPRTPIYTLFGLGDTDRPVKDSLPGFNADRGGIVAATPPTLADGNFGAGFWAYVEGDGWLASSDAATGDPGDATKVLYDATCPAEFTADLEAITSMLRFENPMARAYPELVRRNMELAVIAHARFAETRLLRRMHLLCTDHIAENPSIPMGATRDLLLSLRTIVASFRNRHRMSGESPVDIWAPAWLRDLCAIDISLDGELENVSPALSEIDGFLREAKINPVWHLDSMPGSAAAQLMPTDHTFPASAELIIAPPGTFLFLDGGSMDIGVVRDADLVGTNQYIEFSETFEQVAMMGVEALSFTLPVLAIGATAERISTAAGIILS